MLRRFALISWLLLGTAPLAWAATFADAARQLDGEWYGDGFVLKIDSERAQASLDPARPFSWERFLVQEVTEDEIVFSIGAELFQARISSDNLTLTGTAIRGARLLFRGAVPELRP